MGTNISRVLKDEKSNSCSGHRYCGDACDSTPNGDDDPVDTPGFELLTLVAALGVAFILLRCRR